MPLPLDTRFYHGDKIIVSYGPRRDAGDSIEQAEEDAAEFWGVYTHDEDGLAFLAFDVHTQADAELAAAKLYENYLLKESLRDLIAMFHDANSERRESRNPYGFVGLKKANKLLTGDPYEVDFDLSKREILQEVPITKEH